MITILVPTCLLTAIVLLHSCAENKTQATNNDSSQVSVSQPTVLHPGDTSALPSATDVMNAVRDTYSSVAFYQARGVNKEHSEFNGKSTDGPDIPFRIEYESGRGGRLNWTENGTDKALTLDGRESWLTIDGRREETFSSPRDALMRVGFAEKGRSLFAISVFIFREEQHLKGFFSGLVDPEVMTEETVDGYACYVLAGTYRGVEAKNKYWIDKESSLIRRVEKIIVIRTERDGNEYVSTWTTTEDYSDIVVRTIGQDNNNRKPEGS